MHLNGLRMYNQRDTTALLYVSVIKKMSNIGKNRDC